MSKKTKISLIREIRSRKSPHFYSFHAPKAKKSHFYIKKTSKNLHVSQKKHNFAAVYGLKALFDIVSISVHNNINKFNYNQNDETESIEKMYDSRRVPKAAGRGGAW